MSTFNSASHVRSQYLYYPSDFQTTLPGGTITAIYIRPSGNQTNSTFDSLTIQIGTTTQTQLTSGAWVNYNFDTVFYADQHIFPTVTSNTWLKIELDKPYTWDGVSNLVVDLSQKGYARGFAQAWHNPGGSPAPRMKYGGMTTPTYINNFPPIFLGFDVCVMPSVELGNDTLLCDGATKILDAENVGAAYLWNDQSTNPTLAVNAAGTYFVTVNNNGCEASDTINITTGNKASGNKINSYNVGNGTYNFLVENAWNVETYDWNFGDGNTSTAVSPNHTYTIPGTYTVTVKISSICGDTTLTTSITDLLSTNKITKSSINVYPNPTKNKLIIEGAANINNITIFNLLGQKMQNIAIFNNSISLEQLPTGSYILEIDDMNGKTYKKIEKI